MTLKGFTIIELLFTVLIVSALVSIALPKYTKTFEIARERDGVINLRAIDNAYRHYKLGNGTYLDSGGSQAVAWINTNLRLGIIENKIAYSCTSTSVTYECFATSNAGWQLRVDTSGIVSCSLPTCPSCTGGGCPY